MSSSFAPCFVIPTYDNPETVAEVVRAVREASLAFDPKGVPVVLVDDGSGPAGREAVAALGRDGSAMVLHRSENSGKGAALCDGFRHALERGYTHALQVDADGQHDLSDVPHLFRAAERRPSAVVLGSPVYDESAPKGRLWGRKISRFWTHVETFGRVIEDPMCGYRVYPLAATVEVMDRCGRRMEFDNEIAVRLVWRGCPVENIPTRVRYPDGGVSHFHYLRDNLRISWMHSRLAPMGILRGLGRLLRGQR